ncbi:MAG TPA: glycosyltransferase, partial [Solirubrobacteraceae bacterium]
RDAGRHVFLTLHSVRGARPAPETARALRALDRILIHTDADRERLAALGVDDNVTTLAPGFPPALGPTRDEIRRALGIAGGPVVGTFGFLRPHKGLLELIEATALLRRRHPDVLLLALAAMDPSAESEAYRERCAAAVERLGLADHCRILTDFLDADACRTALRACDVVVLPYRSTIDSASGAVRAALAARVPVVATRSAALDDVSDLVVRIDRVDASAIARGVTAVLGDRRRADELLAATERRLARDAWDVVGRTYAKFVDAALADLRPFAKPYPIAAAVP